MIKRVYIISLVLLLPLTGICQNTVSGIINSYYQVNIVSASSVTITTTTGLNAGDTIMLYQSKGADINLTNSSSFGNINSINNAGNWEILKIQSINTSTGLVTFTCNITKSFTPPLQLIRVPSYNNAVVNATLSCLNYDGIKGGVLCMIVRNTLTFNAGIDVSGKGHMGAQPMYSTTSNCANMGAGYQKYFYTSFCDSAGLKGDGVFGDPIGMFALGRGKSANGGGGGNGLNSAGGGGGNGGSGGKGGAESDWCISAYDVGGLGGVSLSSYYSNGKIFMGGGGGAGLKEIAASDPLPGGGGGGIVIIIAGNIIGNGKVISAMGETVTGTTYEESAGGGGAGGTVLIYANSVSGSLSVYASGGKGGNTLGGSSAYCRGSGGGGGGGMILYNTGASGISKNFSGGSPGTVASGCTSWLGQTGNDGSETIISTLPLNCISLSTTAIINTIQADQIICSGKTPAALTGNVPSGSAGTITGYLWEQSINGGANWTACPAPNTNQGYSFSSGLTQTTIFRRQVTFSNGDISYSNIVTITVNSNPSASATNTGSYCTGQTISLSCLPTGMDNYLWSGPLGFTSNNQSPTISSATTTMSGSYSVTVTNSNGCTSIATTTVQVYTNPSATAGNSGPFCVGSNIMLNLTTNGTSYTWSGPGSWSSTALNPSRPSATPAMAGIYYVTVTNPGNCTSVSQTTVVVNPNPTIFNVTGGGAICSGAPGQPVGLSGSQTGVSYSLFRNGSNTVQTLTGNGSAISFATQTIGGNYTIVATNISTLCSSNMQGTATITIDPAINIQLTQSPISCNGSTDGTLSASPSGGTTPFSYHWNTGINAPSISGLGQGTYSVTVTDGLGCTSFASFNLNEPSSIILWGEQVIQPSCSGGNNGILEMGADGGVKPYTFLWSTGSSDSVLTNLTAGTYTCTVTDNHGCTIVQGLPLDEPFPVQPFIDGSLSVQPTCFGSSDGVVVAGANGGTGPGTYTFLWGNGSTDSVLSGMPQNYYYVTVTDAHGCTGTDTALLVWPPQILISATTIIYPTVLNNDGYIEISVTNGVPPFSYNWSNSENTPVNDSLPAGTYYVTVTDNNSCTSVGSFVLLPSSLDLIISGDSVICSGSNGMLYPISSFPVISNATYLWNTGDTTDTIIISPLTSQYYSLTITDPLSTLYVDSIWIEVIPVPSFHITGDSVICEGNPATLSPTSVSNNYTYLWNTGHTGQTLVVNPPTSIQYSLTITDNGCSSSDSIVVDVSPSFTVQIAGDTSICLYDTSVFRVVTNNPSITNYTYLWNPYSTADSLYYWAWTGTGNHNVFVTVTAGACTAVQQHTLLVKPIPNVSITGPTLVCNGETTTLTCTGTGFIYYWNVGTIGNSITINPTDTTTYWVGTQGANGCRNIAFHTINVNPVSEILFLNNDSVCSGNQAIISASLTGAAPWDLIVTNGSQTFPFNNISSGNFQLSFIPQNAGLYNILSFIDGNGCPGNTNTSFNITINPTPVAFAGNDTSVCSNVCMLNAVINPPDTGRWYQTPNVLFNNFTNPHATATVLLTNNPFTMVWTVGNQYGCTDSDTVIVTYRDNPSTPFAGEDMQVMYATSVQLNATPPTTGTGTGHWNLIDGTGIIADTMLYNTNVSELSLGDNIFRWTVENPPCPSKYDEVIITVFSVTIPTGYSPNGDGTNDNFVVTGIELYPENTLEVFNRWGIMVYSAYPYYNNWSGKDLNDHLLPDDTYFYVFHLNEKEFIKGYVIIHR